MKNLLISLFAIIACVACSESGETDNGGGNNNQGGSNTPTTPTITLSKSSVSFEEFADEEKITFSATADWVAEIVNDRADSWLSISPKSGTAGDAFITIKANNNDTHDERNATVIIKAGSASKTINVSQKQKDALTVTSSKFEVGAEGGEVKIEIKANINFEYEINESAKDWIKYEGTRAMKTSTLAFKVAENDDTKKREGKIAIKSGEFNEVVTIYQVGSEPSIVISQNEYVVSSDGETIAVEVTSNVDVAVEVAADVDWISENTTRASSTNTYRFDIQPSEDYNQRTAEIRFTNKDNNLSEVVTVTQTQKDALVVAKDSYSVDSEGDQIQIEVGHNIDFDIEISADWITREQTRAFTTETLVFNIAKNPTNDNREGAIIFKSKDGKLSQIVKVYQAQKDALIISKKDIVVSAESGTISFELQTNVEFKVSEPNVDWLRAVTTRGLTTHTLHYEYDANTSYDSREAQIIVTDTKNNKSETITITQAQKDAIVLAKDSYVVESEGGQIQIEVGHNIDFNVEISADWITKVDTRALTKETLIYNITYNTNKIQREGSIIFKSNDGAISQPVTIIQKSADSASNEIVIEFVSPTYYSEDQVNVMLANAFGGYISSYSYSDGVCVITLNNACTAIPDSAFEYKGGIKNVILGENITSIANHAFFRSSIKSISMKNVKTIGSAAFALTKLSDVELPNTLETIGENAFLSAEFLTHINIPDSVSEIGESAFRNCSSLENITFDADNVEFIGDICELFEGCENLSAFYGKCASDDNRCLIINNTLYSFIPRDLTEYIIPQGITKLEDSAFVLCNYINNKISIILSDDVTDIERAFGYVHRSTPNISHVTIGRGITSIGESAFCYCSDLKSITMGECVASIGTLAFPKTLTKVNITNLSAWCNIEFEDYNSHPFSYSEMGDLFIEGKKVSELIITSDITEIKPFAFYGCSLTNVTLEDGVTSIGKQAFYNCRSLENVTIPNSITTINEKVFSADSKGFNADEDNKCTEYYNWDQDPIYIYIKAETPPTLQGDIKEIFRYNYNLFKISGAAFDMYKYRKYSIYVPATVLNDYKAEWSEIESHINGYYF